MKTLVNKNNPAIRITAPEIITAHPPVSNEGYVYWIPAINEMYSPIDWTLVDEEPEKLHIDKPRGYKLASEDATANGFNQPKEPVDLEKEIEKAQEHYFALKDKGFSLDSMDVSVLARHFYELGLNARKEE